MRNLEFLAKFSEQNAAISRRDFLNQISLIGGGFLFNSKVNDKIDDVFVNKSTDPVLIFPDDNSTPPKHLYNLAAQANSEYKRISNYLDRIYNRGKVIIRVSKLYKRIRAHFRDSSLPGTIELPSFYVIRGVYPTAHELTHIIADTSPERAYLTEGLPMHVQYEYGESKDSSPNLEADLHTAFSKNGIINGKLKIPMLELKLQTAFSEEDRNKKIILYFQAGSFVKYLIDEESKGNIKKFMEFYYDGDFIKHFGKTFGQLENDWLKFIMEKFK